MGNFDQSLSLRERAEALHSQGIFVGGPIHKFEDVGRNQLSILLRNGLNPDSTVLDVGCGCLRGGWWVMRFLDPGCYHGIEPNVEMLQAGVEELIGPETMAEKAPRFDHNDAFDFSGFDVHFDFVIARSIWTHASPGQIETMLDQFVATKAPEGVMLTSILECPWYRRQDDADSWVGKSHTSKKWGIVRYRMSWIEKIAAARGLTATKLDEELDQTWVRIS